MPPPTMHLSVPNTAPAPMPQPQPRRSAYTASGIIVSSMEPPVPLSQSVGARRKLSTSAAATMTAPSVMQDRVLFRMMFSLCTEK